MLWGFTGDLQSTHCWPHRTHDTVLDYLAPNPSLKDPGQPQHANATTGSDWIDQVLLVPQT